MDFQIEEFECDRMHRTGKLVAGAVRDKVEPPGLPAVGKRSVAGEAGGKVGPVCLQRAAGRLTRERRAGTDAPCLLAVFHVAWKSARLRISSTTPDRRAERRVHWDQSQLPWRIRVVAPIVARDLLPGGQVL